MDKIPAALQHKIDYINALDIPARQKAVRTSTEIVDYWAVYYGMKQTSMPIPPIPPMPTMPPNRVIKDEKFQDQNKPDQFAYQLSCCLWVGSFVLCGLIGLVLGVAFGGSL
jgi:hypothetical protein